jgi:hypothetical protein
MAIRTFKDSRRWEGVMMMLSETDEYQAHSILNGFDLVAMAMLIGILLFILGTPPSWGATSPVDPGARVSSATNSELFERLEQPTRETTDKASISRNIEKVLTVRPLPRVTDMARIGSGRSENEVRADETTKHLLTR